MSRTWEDGGYHPWFPEKVPFEDSVLAYIRAHPGATFGDCMDELGIGLTALIAAITSLESKGIVRPAAPEDDEEGGTGR